MCAPSSSTLSLVVAIAFFLLFASQALEVKYKAELAEHFGLTFNSLFTMTNMPIKRFADMLHRRGELQQYLELLVRNFNGSTTAGLMCTNHVSVGWDGRVYDCDFNQQLQMEVLRPVALSSSSSSGGGDGIGRSGCGGDFGGDGDDGATEAATEAVDVFNLGSLDDLAALPVATDSHCFGCTAGMGSS